MYYPDSEPEIHKRHATCVAFDINAAYFIVHKFLNATLILVAGTDKGRGYTTVSSWAQKVCWWEREIKVASFNYVDGTY